MELVDQGWTSSFLVRNNIVLRKQTGELQIMDNLKERIKRRVAYFLGQLARNRFSEELNENDVENTDETHFVIKVDNGFTLGFRGNESVK